MFTAPTGLMQRCPLGRNVWTDFLGSWKAQVSLMAHTNTLLLACYIGYKHWYKKSVNNLFGILFGMSCLSFNVNSNAAEWADILLPGLCDLPFYFYKWEPGCTMLYFNIYHMLRAFNFLLGAMWSLWIYTNWEQRCVPRTQRSEVGLQRSRCDAVPIQKVTEMQMQYVGFQSRGGICPVQFWS